MAGIGLSSGRQPVEMYADRGDAFPLNRWTQELLLSDSPISRGLGHVRGFVQRLQGGRDGLGDMLSEEAVRRQDTREALMAGDRARLGELISEPTQFGMSMGTLFAGTDIGPAIASSGIGIGKAGKALTSEQPVRPNEGTGKGGKGLVIDGPAPKHAHSVAKRGTADLRSMSQDEAIEAARKGDHIVPREGGGFEGAPGSVRSMEDLEAMRGRFDTAMQRGVGGVDWYERTRDAFREVTGGDPARMDMIAGENAMWSPLADPQPNLGWALQAHNAYEVGRPAQVVRDTTKPRLYNATRDAGGGGLDLPQGPKTGLYRQNINPNEEFSTTGVNDTWHAKNFGFSQEEIDAGLHGPQHRFLDNETMLAVARANEGAYGGRQDWTARSAQAAPWTTAKGIGLVEKGRAATEEEGIAMANRTPADAIPLYTASATYESVPGAGTGHMDELINEPLAARERFTNRQGMGWETPSGNDSLYQALGMYSRNTQPMTGAFTPEGGQLEINPGRAARPLVSYEPKRMGVDENKQPILNPKAEAGRVIDEPSREMMNTAEAMRGYMDMQLGSAWHRPIVGNKAGASAGAFIDNQGPLSADQMTRLQASLEPFGLSAVDTGSGVTLMDFADDASGQKIGKLLGTAQRPGPLTQAIDQVMPGSAVTRADVQSGYVDYDNRAAVPGGRSSAENQGQGFRTAVLSDYLKNPTLLRKLDADPAIKQKARDRIKVAQDMAKRGYEVREDQLRALRYIAEGGPSLLLKKWQEGAVLPGIAAGVLALATGDDAAEGGS